MASPDPPHHPTPTPTPRPATTGYVSPADYLTLCYDQFSVENPTKEETYTSGEILEYIGRIKDVLYAAET